MYIKYTLFGISAVYFLKPNSQTARGGGLYRTDHAFYKSRIQSTGAQTATKFQNDHPQVLNSEFSFINFTGFEFRIDPLSLLYCYLSIARRIRDAFKLSQRY